MAAAYPRAAEVPAKRTGEIGEGLRSWIETEQEEEQGEIEEVWDQTWGAGQRRTLLLSSFCFPFSYSEESRWADDGGESEGSGEAAVGERLVR